VRLIACIVVLVFCASCASANAQGIGQQVVRISRAYPLSASRGRVLVFSDQGLCLYGLDEAIAVWCDGGARNDWFATMPSSTDSFDDGDFLVTYGASVIRIDWRTGLRTAVFTLTGVRLTILGVSSQGVLIILAGSSAGKAPQLIGLSHDLHGVVWTYPWRLGVVNMSRARRWLAVDEVGVRSEHTTTFLDANTGDVIGSARGRVIDVSSGFAVLVDEHGGERIRVVTLRDGNATPLLCEPLTFGGRIQCVLVHDNRVAVVWSVRDDRLAVVGRVGGDRLLLYDHEVVQIRASSDGRILSEFDLHGTEGVPMVVQGHIVSWTRADIDHFITYFHSVQPPRSAPRTD